MAIVNSMRKVCETLVWRIAQFISDIIIAIIYRGPNDALVPIREDCLLDSATNVANRIRQKKITSVEVVQACIRRIEDINDTCNCVVEKRFEEALREAEAVDRMIAEGMKTEQEMEQNTPFLGVPFTVKDGLGVKGMVQAGGVVARKNTKATEDTECVALLRAAGAIVIATTNTPELASWWETNNKLYGRTRNPYHSQYLPGGSSGGEGAVLAAAGSFMGLGTDVGGSVRIPAAYCGIFAHKPTPGVVPDKGSILNTTQADKINGVGPMSKSAVDLRNMLRVLDPSKKFKLDEKVNLKKLRYFYMDDDMSNPLFSPVDPVDSDVKNSMQKVFKYLNEAHGVTVEKVSLTHMKHASDMWWAKMMDQDGAALMASNASLAKIFIELVRTLIGWSQHTFESPVVWFLQYMAPKRGTERHSQLIKLNNELSKTFQELLGDDGVFFYPTSSKPAMKHVSSIFHAHNFAYTGVFNSTKMPVTQCQISQTQEGLPIGFQVAAARYNDHLTLAVAEELEKAFEGWKPPPSQPKW